MSVRLAIWCVLGLCACSTSVELATGNGVSATQADEWERPPGTRLKGIDELASRLYFAWLLDEIEEEITEPDKLLRFDHPAGDPECPLTLADMIGFGRDEIAYGTLFLRRSPSDQIKFAAGQEFFHFSTTAVLTMLTSPSFGKSILVHELQHYAARECFQQQGIFLYLGNITYYVESSASVAQAEYLTQTKEHWPEPLPFPVFQVLSGRMQDYVAAYAHQNLRHPAWKSLIQAERRQVDYQLSTAMELQKVFLHQATAIMTKRGITGFRKAPDRVWNLAALEIRKLIPDFEKLEDMIKSWKETETSPAAMKAWATLNTFIKEGDDVYALLIAMDNRAEADLSMVPENGDAYERENVRELYEAIRNAREVVNKYNHPDFFNWLYSEKNYEQDYLAELTKSRVRERLLEFRAWIVSNEAQLRQGGVSWLQMQRLKQRAYWLPIGEYAARYK